MSLNWGLSLVAVTVWFCTQCPYVVSRMAEKVCRDLLRVGGDNLNCESFRSLGGALALVVQEHLHVILKRPFWFQVPSGSFQKTAFLVPIAIGQFSKTAFLVPLPTWLFSKTAFSVPIPICCCQKRPFWFQFPCGCFPNGLFSSNSHLAGFQYGPFGFQVPFGSFQKRPFQFQFPSGRFPVRPFLVPIPIWQFSSMAIFPIPIKHVSSTALFGPNSPLAVFKKWPFWFQFPSGNFQKRPFLVQIPHLVVFKNGLFSSSSRLAFLALLSSNMKETIRKGTG